MRTVSLLTGPATHLDHLGVLSSLLDIPLIVTEEKTYALAKQFYPDLKIFLKNLSDLSYGFFAENYDVIFQSGKFFTAELKPFIELLFNKKMRFVFCPHGNSDKGHSLRTHPEQDVSLVYGQHLLDHLHKTGATQNIEKIFRTGNYRYAYYLKHRAFYDALFKAEISHVFPRNLPTILYAPTWGDNENPSSFFNVIHTLIDQLSPSFNLLVKLHPFTIEDHAAEIEKLPRHPAVHFIFDFPAIYPILAHCDLYLGDYSSIGYDFLSFDKPLYFLYQNNLKNRSTNASNSVLQECGHIIESISTIGNFITSTYQESKSAFREQRSKTNSYAFEQSICISALKSNIINYFTS